jgi:hypothetical protein
LAICQTYANSVSPVLRKSRQSIEHRLTYERRLLGSLPEQYRYFPCEGFGRSQSAPSEVAGARRERRASRPRPLDGLDAATHGAPAWCRDQRYARNAPNPRLGSDDADIVRASQRQDAVEDMDRHADFSHPTFVYTLTQAVTDHLFPSSDRRLDLGAPVLAGGILPGPAAALGDAPEMEVALCRRRCGLVAHLLTP